MNEQESATERPVDELTYSEASDELEGIIRQLESNRLELEESLERYQRGVELLSSLRGRLASAEQRVSALMGEIEVVDDATQDSTLS